MTQLQLFENEQEISVDDLESEIAELELLIQKIDAQEEFYRKNKSFEWNLEFPQLCDNEGNWVGFDVVVGNPPYIGIRTSHISKQLSAYYKTNYETAKGQFDLFALFIELSYNILKENGFHSFIVSKRLASNENFEKIRQLLIEKMGLWSFADSQMPFKEADVESNIIFNHKNTKCDSVSNYLLTEKKLFYKNNVKTELIKNLPFQIFPFFIELESLPILLKINKNANYLGDFVEIIRGFEFGFNHLSINLNGKGYKIVRGENIQKYIVVDSNYFVDADFNDTKTFKQKEYFFTKPKLLTRFVSNRLMFAYDNFGYCNTNVIYNVIKKENCNLELKYLLGILNSKLINYWFYNTYSNTDKIFPHIQKNQLAAIPIALNKNQNVLIKLVNQILQQKQENPNSDTSKFEQQIDNEVYKLYNLTLDEIGIIESQ